MISVIDKTLCCGCGACRQACLRNCISMEKDDEGFLYPKVDEKNCIACDICDKVCPIKRKFTVNEANLMYPIAYGGWHKNSETRAASSSGGAFSLLAEEILSRGGLVFGCALNSNLHAEHIVVDKVEDLNKLRGSKYVQSEMGEVYLKVKLAVNNGKNVLFVGTPCQAAGLYSYMDGKEYDNLYIVDFICHGVPSPEIFESYIKSEEKKKGSRMVSHRFRNKDYGWSQTGLQLGSKSEFEDGTVIRRYPAFRDSFMNGFLDDIYLRPSCYNCKFKSISKGYSDFTIADFWGVNKVDSGLNDKKGTSLILVNKPHGNVLWNDVKKAFEYKKVDFKKAIRRNKSLVQSAKMNRKRKDFFIDYNENGFNYVEKKYMSAFTWAWHKGIKIFTALFSKFEQFVKFSIVGCTNTLINLTVYYICIYIGMYYIIAYSLGFLISVCNAFFWNNKYVFKNKQEKNVGKAFIKVVISYGVSFLISIVLMSLMVEFLYISPHVAPILKLVITIPLNFSLNKVWAFKERIN